MRFLTSLYSSSSALLAAPRFGTCLSWAASQTSPGRQGLQLLHVHSAPDPTGGRGGPPGEVRHRCPQPAEQRGSSSSSVGSPTPAHIQSQCCAVTQHIGFHYKLVTPLRDSTQHIKDQKLPLYAEQADTIAASTTCSHDSADSFLGRCNFASSIYLSIKQNMGEINRCRWVKSRLNPTIFPLSNLARTKAANIATLIRENKGLPLMCNTNRPHHADITTVCHRADACLNETGENGFGIYWIIPNTDGTIRVLALMDVWSTAEELLFDKGGGVPAAEACAALLGVRAVEQHKIMQPHHRDLLQLSDSSTTATKFSSLKLGAVVMDDIRDNWISACEHLRPHRVSISHLPREFNVSHAPHSPNGWFKQGPGSHSLWGVNMQVGSDLLSKQQWDLFVRTLMAAGLPQPTRIELSASNRDLSDVLSSLAAAA